MKHSDEVVRDEPVLAGAGAYRRRQTALVLLGAVLLVAVSALSAWWLRGPSADTDALASDLSDEQTLKRGRLLYQVNCVSCHGLEGRGDGPSAAELNPPPRDLALGPWRLARAQAKFAGPFAMASPARPCRAAACYRWPTWMHSSPS